MKTSPPVDVVVVSYNSRDTLRDCVEPLAGEAGIRVIVVDNASSDGSLEAVADLSVTAIPLPRNGGFAHGCNAGIRKASAPYILLLNPDARIDTPSVRLLVGALEAQPDAGLAAPRIVHTDGSLEYSQRRFPRLVSTYAQALFLHRLFPRADWTDELVRDEAAYSSRAMPDWVSGACMLIRRTALEEVGGLDEGFFMYSEDIDLCRRLRAEGYQIIFEPDAVVDHVGGASAPRARLLPVLAESRVRYATKHRSRAAALLERIGVALGSLTHALLGRGGWPTRIGYAKALGRSLMRSPES